LGNNGPNWTKPGATQPAVGFEDKESHSPPYGLLATETVRLCHGPAKQCFNFDHDMNLSLRAFFTQGKRSTPAASTRWASPTSATRAS
jgi:hypothetical protein